MTPYFLTLEKSGLLVLLFTIAVQPARSATIISRLPLAGGESFLSEPDGEQSADDFFLTADTRITSLRWWGAYISSAAETDDFTIKLFESQTDLPNLNPAFQFSSLSVNRTDSGITDSFGDTVYEYQAQLPQNVVLEGQTTAYVSVVNSTADGWFWIKSDNTGSNWFRLDDQDLWLEGSGEVGGDLAFELSGLVPPGDFDDSSHVNGTDFLAWQQGNSPLAVFANDLIEWQTFYGESAPLATAARAIPEPTSLLLHLASVVFCLLSRRDRHSSLCRWLW